MFSVGMMNPLTGSSLNLTKLSNTDFSCIDNEVADVGINVTVGLY